MNIGNETAKLTVPRSVGYKLHIRDIGVIEIN